MKRLAAFFLMLLMISLLWACHKEELVPTGYPSGEVQRPFLVYHGTLYVYADELLEHTALPLNCSEIGRIASVDNKNMPQEDFAASRMDVGTVLYSTDEETPPHIYADVIWGEAGPKYMIFSICTEY